METVTFCRVCKNKKIVPFFDLGKQPLANSLLKRLDEQEMFYPLSLSWCPGCSLVQLNQTVEPKELFSKYVWVTGTSKIAREFSKIFYKELISRYQKTEKKKGRVLEIASNDGTFLLPFIKNGFKVLGVDPAQNIVNIAKTNGVPSKCCFFSSKSAKEIVEEYGQAQIIFARNVLPHVANTRDFVKGLQICLHKNGILAIEVHYAKKILEKLHYDSIYHEHLCYFTFKSLERLLNDFKLHVFDIVESPISGGSLIVYTKKHKVTEAPIVQCYRNSEKENKINAFDTWQNFAQKANSHCKKLLNILNNVSKDNRMIVGYGASARSSTLLNFCGIDSGLISVIADQNSLKQKLFTAGTHIPIDSPGAVMAKNPKCILILAWNFAKEIIDNLKDKFNYQGKVIIPLPNEPVLKEIK
jgi:hypothetical protein